MRKRMLCRSVCLLGIVVAASATNLWAQNDQGYIAGNFAADQTPTPVAQNLARRAAGADARPTEGCRKRAAGLRRLPPPPRSNDEDLARRVADLEKQLADFAKAAEGAKARRPASRWWSPAAASKWT